MASSAISSDPGTLCIEGGLILTKEELTKENGCGNIKSQSLFEFKQFQHIRTKYNKIIQESKSLAIETKED